MRRGIAVGIDIGTRQVKVLVAEKTDEIRGLPKIIGTGIAESKGLRHGYIINSGDVTESIRSAVQQAESKSGFKIKRAFLSIGGVGLESAIGSGGAVVSRGDGEITEMDLEKVIEVARQNLPEGAILNRKIIQQVPLKFKIDGREVIGNRPIGMKGIKLDARVLFITSLSQHLDDMIEAVTDAGIEVEDVVPSPVAASLVSLTKTQKMVGSVLANIGGETVSIIVFENNLPISLEVFPMGSTDITNDIALGLRVSLDEAESIKLGAITNANYPKKKLEEITVSRLSDIFELIDAHLKKIGKSGMLPAGIVMTGGGSGLATIEDLAKAVLRLPSKTLVTSQNGEKEAIKDAYSSVAYGLCISGLLGDGLTSEESHPIKTAWRHFLKAIKDALAPLLP